MGGVAVELNTSQVASFTRVSEVNCHMTNFKRQNRFVVVHTGFALGMILRECVCCVAAESMKLHVTCA